MTEQAHEFTVGDRVRVGGAYDQYGDNWMKGGSGYTGTIRKLSAKHAAVELDEELRLEAWSQDWDWEDFGTGSKRVVRKTRVAHGHWLTLSLAWTGRNWTDPGRLHVGLTPAEPDLDAIPRGGGIGYWVESHASVWPLA